MHFLLILFSSLSLIVSDDIRWPTNPPTIEEKPVPAAEPVPVNTLNADEWLVVESDVAIIVRRFPEDIIDVESTTGPIRVRGKFAGGNGKIETRTIGGDHVYLLTSVSSGVVCVDLIPVGLTTETDIVRHVLTVTDGTKPNPPPKPDPGPVPPKPDPVDPVQPEKLQVVIIKDSAAHASYPASQISVMYGEPVRGYLNDHCATTDGVPDFRLLSHRQDVSKSAKWIQEAFAEPRTTMPWIVIVTPTKRISGPLPVTIPEAMYLLRKYGGP